MTNSPSQAEVASIRDGAQAVLLGNLKKGRDATFKRDYTYVCPSRRSYPWQWFWDSCFHAIALSHIDLNLAKAELLNLLSVQQEDGFIPHVIHWGSRFVAAPWAYWQSKLSLRPRTTALIQPPVLAQAVCQVAERSQDLSFLTEALEKVKGYYLWLRDHRDPDADHLISVISPFETGMDQLPAYDQAIGLKNPSRMGLHVRQRVLDLQNLFLGRNYNLDVIFRHDRFNVEDVLVNCVYAQGLRDISRMCAMAGDQAACDSFAHMAQRTEGAILSKCYDQETGAFWSLASREEQPLKVLTVSSLLPVVLESIGKQQLERLVEGHLLREQEFWPPYPIPSVAMSEPSFRPSGEFVIWRGPTWINTNWLIMKGLQQHGYDEAANAIARRSAELVLKSGFREYYNPLNGEGYGARDFGWSTLVVDML